MRKWSEKELRDKLRLIELTGPKDVVDYVDQLHEELNMLDRFIDRICGRLVTGKNRIEELERALKECREAGERDVILIVDKVLNNEGNHKN